MKIAVAVDQGKVSEHFGHCEAFCLFEMEGSKVINEEQVANPGHQPGFLPNFLNDLGVKVVIAGGMGQGAKDIFIEKGITVIVGVSGEAQKVVVSYQNGELKEEESTCSHDHDPNHQCGE